jgi:glycerol kinase
MTHILALDQGTTSSRALVFDTAGRVVAMAQRELPQHYPQPGQGRARRASHLERHAGCATRR